MIFFISYITKKIYFSFLLLSMLFVLVQSCGSENGTPKEMSANDKGYEVKAFEVTDSIGTNTGWGYDIYTNGKKLIHQPIIPAIQGNHSFNSKNDALKVGMFMVSKMKSDNSGLPTLTTHELDSLGIK